MAVQFLVPLFANILSGMIGHGLAENSRAREANELRAQSRAKREALQPIINRLNQAADTFDMDEQFVRDFSRAANQLTAQSAGTGMTNAGTGGLDQVRGDLLTSGLAQLAQAKSQQDMQRQQLLAQLLSDDSLYGGVGGDENVLGATLLGGLLGGVQGGVGNLNSYLSSESGMKALQDWLGGLGAQSVPAGTSPGFGVSTSGPTVAQAAPALPMFGVGLGGMGALQSAPAINPAMYTPSRYYGYNYGNYYGAQPGRRP